MRVICSEGVQANVWREGARDGAAGESLVTFIAVKEGRWVALGTGLTNATDEPDPILAGMFVVSAEGLWTR
jgi:hypothetical protein